MKKLLSAAIVLACSATLSAQCLPTCSETPGATVSTGSIGACSVGGVITTDNHFYRVYNSAQCGLGGPVDICSIDFGVDIAFSGDGTSGVCAMIRVYSDSILDDAPGAGGFPVPIGEPGIPNPGSVTLLREEPIIIPDNGGTGPFIFHHEWSLGPVFWDPFAGLGTELIIELFVPNGFADGSTFFFGGDPAFETGPFYIQASGCGIPAPSPLVFGGILDVTFAPAGGCTCLGPQMVHPGTGEDLFLASANLTAGTPLTDGHGGATEKAATGGDFIRLRWASVLGNYWFEPYFMLGTLLPSGSTSVPVIFPGVTGHDIYADIASAAPNGTTIIWGTPLPNVGPPLINRDCDGNDLVFSLPLALTGTGGSLMVQVYVTPVFGAVANNGAAVASNGHRLGPF